MIVNGGRLVVDKRRITTVYTFKQASNSGAANLLSAKTPSTAEFRPFVLRNNSVRCAVGLSQAPHLIDFRVAQGSGEPQGSLR